MLLPRLPVTVDSEATLLFVVDNPVDSDVMPVEVDVDSEAIELVAVDKPVEVEVDSDVTVLLVVDKPVDSELTPLCAVLMPVEV
ncbi:hypothetical protein, partial [Burkholderia ubonensis]|uniref:hypothetical protein n=1 Tax=Burkholderia ubonensis TaxID=101571 RepID=UPI0022B7601A